MDSSLVSEALSLGKKLPQIPSFLIKHPKLIYKSWFLALHRVSPMVVKSSHVLIKKNLCLLQDAISVMPHHRFFNSKASVNEAFSSRNLFLSTIFLGSPHHCLTARLLLEEL